VQEFIKSIALTHAKNLRGSILAKASLLGESPPTDGPYYQLALVYYLLMNDGLTLLSLCGLTVAARLHW
jgi:hypothetical protein